MSKCAGEPESVSAMRVVASLVAVCLSAASVRGAGECDTSNADSKSLVAALKRGDFGCASMLARSVDNNNLAVNEVLMELRSMEGKLKEVKEALKEDSSSNDPTKFMSPAHQWAQSGDTIFLSVKFAHKWDAPATLVSESDVDEVLFEEEKLTVKAHKGDKRFVLELPLLRPIDAEASTWVTASVGRMSITMKKKSDQKEWWPRLNKDKTKPTNQGIWWDKQETYDKEKEEVQKNEKASTAPKGLKDKLAAMKKKKTAAKSDNEIEQAKREEMGADESPELGGGEASQEDLATKSDRTPRTSAIKRADKRKQAAHKQAQAAKEKIVEDGKAKAKSLEARTKLDVEDVDKKLEFQYKQIDADLPKDAADPDFNPTDVPEEFPDVPEGIEFLEKKAKKTKKKKKAKKEEL